MFHQQKYFKESASKFKENCRLVSSDDGAIIPADEVGQAILTGVRTQNASLVRSNLNCPNLAALNHD